MASIKVKQISSSSKTHMRVTVSVYEKYANQCLHMYNVYVVHNAHGVLRIYTIWKRAAHVCRKNLWIPASISWRLFAHFRTQKLAASVGLRHSGMNVSAGLSDTCTTHSLLLRMFPVKKAGRILVPDPATVHCGRRCDCASVAETHSCMFIHTRMHANSDTKMVTCMCSLHNGEIRFTSMNIFF